MSANNLTNAPEAAQIVPPRIAAAGRTARKAAAALLASAARIVAMTAFCVAVVALPAACSIVTGHKPVNCEVDFCDL